MIMKKKIILISTLSLLAFSFNSCSNDFIDVPTTEAISAEDYEMFNNDAGAESFVTTIYAKYLDWNISSFSWIGVTSIASDEGDKGSSPGDSGSDKDLLDALNFTPTSGSFNDVWEGNYQAVNRCNQALKYLPLLDKVDSALRNRLIGEAKFMRAFTYFTLVRGFGDIPLVDHVPVAGNTEDNNMLFVRKSKEEIYAFIEQDLKDAAASLPDRSEYGAENRGRASRGAAYALLAKVSLYQKKWQAVVDNCNMVTGYSLTPEFQDIYKTSGENNEESIFEIQGMGGKGMPGIQQYSQTQGARGAGGWGWGFNTPSQTLVNAYNAEGDTVRRDATIIFRGSTLYDGREVPTTVENKYYNYKAYAAGGDPGADDTDVNIRYLRYAEVLLMKAEALNELGQTAQAIPLINQVRHRVHLGDTPAVNQNDVRLAVWKERRLELAFEHDRWFDLIRTGQAVEAMAADGKTFTTGKDEMWPIPQTFIKLSNGLTTQNPGY